MEDPNERLSGVLTFHSETGTEGGHWAFQNARHIRQLADDELTYYCTKCGLYRGAGPNGSRVVGGDVSFPEVCKAEDHTFDAVVSRETWSYKGLRILTDGDKLTIFDKDDPSKIVWIGTIALKQFPVFTEHAYGYWIHADQIGMDRNIWARWFLGNYPAELIKARS